MKRQAVSVALTWVLLGVFLVFSNPNKLPVVLLILPFILLFITLYGTWSLIRKLMSRLSQKERPRRHFGMAMCISVILFLVLQSLGQLSLRDVVTMIAIVILGYLYLGRAGVGLRGR